jgi:AraC-like DNA-binding protein
MNKKGWHSNGVRIANYFEAADKRNNWGPRRITDFELILIVDGTAWYQEHNKQSVHVNRGDLLLIPPDVEHVFHCNTEKKSVISCIHFSFNSSPPITTSAIARLGGDSHIFTIFGMIADEYTKHEIDNSEVTRLLLDVVLTKFSNALQNPPKTISRKVRQAIDFIESGFSNKIDRNSVAHNIGVTPEYFSILFRKETGKSFIETLNGIRVRKACELLRHGEINVSQAAYLSGFEDPLYFSRVFRKKTGVSPSVYSEYV